MAALTTQRPLTSGVALTYAAVGGSGDTFVNTGKEFIHVKNANAAACVVTISSGTNVCSFGVTNVAHDKTVSVPLSTGDRMIGPFDRAIFNDASGHVNVSYSVTSSVTIAVISPS